MLIRYFPFSKMCGCNLARFRKLGRLYIMQTTNIYQKWLNHELGDAAALEAMCRTLRNLQDSLEPLSEMEKAARAQISQVVEHLGGRAHVEGFGELQITSPATINGYNRAALDALITDWEAEGQSDIAARIVACRNRTGRVGSLRINRLNKY